MKTVRLGQRESQTLEFKEKAALRDVASIAREVVAMLNATGGKVWVGVREHDQIAVQPEPIPEVDAEIRRLRDHLIDTIEPSPAEQEVAVRRAEGDVIRIDVKPHDNRKPYAYVRSSGRLFVTRVGDRLRPLTREELGTLFEGGTKPESGVESRRSWALSQIQEDLQRAMKVLRGPKRGLFWLRLQPVGEVELRFQELIDSELLTDPEQSGVAELQASFVNAFNRGKSPAPRRSIWLGDERHVAVGEDTAHWLGARRDGGLLLTAPLPSHGVEPFVPREERLLSPFDLLEYPTSMFRLVRAMMGQQGLWTSPTHWTFGWVASLALFGLQDWILRPGTPLTGEFARAYQPPRYDGDEPFVAQPLFYSAREVEEPDRCAFRLVARVYEDAFGLLEKDIPRQFDRRGGRYISDRI